MARRLAGRYGYPEVPDHFKVTRHFDRLKQPLRWRQSRRVFVCSMSDLFHENVHQFDLLQIFDVMEKCKQHTFIVLTKRPKRMYDFIYDHYSHYDVAPPPNIIGMVTAENQRCADERILWLMKTPFAKRGVSVEPMLSEIDISAYLAKTYCPKCGGLRFHRSSSPFVCDECGWIGASSEYINRHRLDLIVCGAETGPKKRPIDLNWARDLRDECQHEGIPFFFKVDSEGNHALDSIVYEEFSVIDRQPSLLI